MALIKNKALLKIGLGKIEDPRERLRKLVATPGTVGDFAWTVLSRRLAYAARRIPEITESVEAIDNAMKWGYAWDLGPFEVWDALGFAATTDRMKADGVALPAWIETMRAASAAGFYADATIWDPQRGDYAPRATDPREVTLSTTLRF